VIRGRQRSALSGLSENYGEPSLVNDPNATLALALISKSCGSYVACLVIDCGGSDRRVGAILAMSAEISQVSNASRAELRR
jgi:hypothetical protein